MTKGGIILNNEMADFSIPGQKSMFGLPPSPVSFIPVALAPSPFCAPVPAPS
jgi:gamma-glutamyltranspeptidase